MRGRKREVDVTAHHRGLYPQPRFAAAKQKSETVNVAKLLAELNGKRAVKTMRITHTMSYEAPLEQCRCPPFPSPSYSQHISSASTASPTSSPPLPLCMNTN